MFTNGKASWTYGFYGVRAKTPCGRGTWPAIWMLPEDAEVQWLNGGEIDIMEHIGFDPTVIHQTLITAAFNFKSGGEQTKAFKLATVCTAFHRYQRPSRREWKWTMSAETPVTMQLKSLRIVSQSGPSSCQGPF